MSGDGQRRRIKKLEYIVATLDRRVALLENPSNVKIKEIEIDLPDHLRKTYEVLKLIGKSTAAQIAQKTNRARAVESGYLNTLVTMGIAHKQKAGRLTIFTLFR